MAFSALTSNALAVRVPPGLENIQREPGFHLRGQLDVPALSVNFHLQPLSPILLHERPDRRRRPSLSPPPSAMDNGPPPAQSPILFPTRRQQDQ